MSGQNTFGVTAQRRSVKGLLDGSLKIDFLHDFDAEGITSFVSSYLFGDESLPVAVRQNDGPISATNKEYRFNVAVEQLQFVDGGPEDIAAASVTWNLDGEVDEVTSGS